MSGDDLKFVVFDCDGTLVDSQHMIFDAMKVAFEAKGLNAPTPDIVRRVVGLSLFYAVKQLIPTKPDEFVQNVVEEYRNAFQELRKKEHIEPLYPNTLSTIKALAEKGYLLGVATGKSARGLRNTLKAHDISDYFISLQTADDNPSKPSPIMLEKAMADAGVSAHQTVLVGDTSFDMLMAKAANTASVGVSWGYHEADELVASGAHHIIHDMSELPNKVSKLIG